jgi:hypothetical protein
MPRSDYPERAAALRGRYLAAEVGVCMDCHTPRDADDRPIHAQAFAGGRTLVRPPNAGSEWPARIVSTNLTPDDTGLGAWSVDDIVRGLERGENRAPDWQPACPPMRSADMSTFAGLSAGDARDIAHFLRSLAPIARAREETPCRR